MTKNYYVVMNKAYPFGAFNKQLQEQETVAVRQIVTIQYEQQKNWRKKINIFKHIYTTSLIKLQACYETDEGFHFLYEYIPIKIQEWLPKLELDQMIKLCKELTNNDIKATFDLKKIGISSQYKPKYFLGWDFQIDPTINREKLNNSYVKSINSIFQPFLQQGDSRKQSTTPKHETGNLKSSNNSFSSVSKADHAIDKAKEALHNAREKRSYKSSGQWKQKKSSQANQSDTNEQSIDKSQQSLQNMCEMSIIELEQQKSQRISKISQQLNEIKSIIGNNTKFDKEKRKSMEFEHNYQPFRKNLDKYKQIEQRNCNTNPFGDNQDVESLSENMLQQLYEALQYEEPQDYAEAQKLKNLKSPQQLQMQKSSKLTQHNKKLVKVEQYLSEYKKNMSGQVVWEDSNSLQKKINDAINNSLKAMGSFKSGKKQN